MKHTDKREELDIEKKSQKDGMEEPISLNAFQQSQEKNLQTDSTTERSDEESTFERTCPQDTTPIKTKRRRNFRKYFKKIKWVVAGLILLGIALVLSPVCAPKTVVLLGDNSLKEEELISMGKINMSSSMYLIRLGAVEKKLSQNPYVKTAHVSRKFPSTLIVDMNMREEVATVNFKEGFAIIDHTGYILRIEQDITKIIKPLITGIEAQKTLKVGEVLDGTQDENIHMILNLLSNVQNAGLLQNISEMNLQDSKNIYMITTRGLRVLLGNGDDLTYKLMQLSQILVDLHTKGISYGIIDMRFDSYPVYREK